MSERKQVYYRLAFFVLKCSDTVSEHFYLDLFLLTVSGRMEMLTMYLVVIIAFVLLLCLLLFALYWIRALKLRMQRLEFDLMLLRKIVRYQGWEARKNALRNSRKFKSL